MDTALKPQLEDIAGIDVFSGMRAEQLEFLLEESVYQDINRGETLYTHGGDKRKMYCLLSGRIKIGLTASSGNERIIDIVLPGKTFGESALFWKREVPVYAQAMTPSLLLVLNNDSVLESMRKWPEVTLSFLELAHLRIQSLLQGMYACCLRTAEQRVNDYLMQNAEALMSDQMQALVNLPANKSVVASSLNLSPETFSRQLHQLENSGVVRVDRHSVHIFDLREIRKRCIS
ncbi:MAG: Crp/Fnr family transcriptional regulator [Chromatiales bacterium]|jgi:CRP-like cAMP-binding protein